MKIGKAILVSLLIWPYWAMGEVISLDGPPGILYALDGEEVSQKGEVSFSIMVRETRVHETWKPIVYMGLVDGNRDSLFYLGIAQLDGEETLSAVYSLYKDGEYLRGKRLIKEIPIGSEVPFTLKWDEEGNVVFTVLSGKEFEEHLPFSNPTERFAASGALADMEITHNKEPQPTQ